MKAEDFWTPEFEYTHRADGSIIMAQRDPLPAYSPTLADYLDNWADQAPDRTWLARREQAGDWRRIAYGPARDMARAIGGALLALGLGPDRPLLILSENSLEHALLGAACFYVGIPYAPLSPAYALRSDDHAKLRDIAARLNPGAVFADDGADFGPACAAIAAPDCKVIHHRSPARDALAYDDLLDGDVDRALAARARITGETVVKYLFTSGSTGAPKAVINTNAMICAMQAMVRDCYRFLTRQPPVVVDWAPWNHAAAGNKTFYLVMTNGGTLYIDDGRPNPDQINDTLRNLRELPCTWYFNVPVGWDLLADALERDPQLARMFFQRLNMMFYAGAGMAQHTWDRLRRVARKTTGREVLLATALGATETAPFALACTRVQDCAGNIGVPGRGLQMKLVPADGKLELRLKGPSITPGYYKEPQKTAEAFDEEGFYCMGDAVRPADPDDLSQGFIFDGRIAENFKLTTGVWVSVGAVRAGLVDAMGGLIADAVIVGENQAELGALLLLSGHAAQMDETERMADLSSRLGRAAHAATGSSSRVRRAMILDRAPSFDKGEITEKGSLNQRAMRANHSGAIKRLYAGGAGVIVPGPVS